MRGILDKLLLAAGRTAAEVAKRTGTPPAKVKLYQRQRERAIDAAFATYGRKARG
jgi:hypothetical protein